MADTAPPLTSSRPGIHAAAARGCARDLVRAQDAGIYVVSMERLEDIEETALSAACVANDHREPSLANAWRRVAVLARMGLGLVRPDAPNVAPGILNELRAELDAIAATVRA